MVCKDAVCLDLAARLCKCNMPEKQRETLIKRSGAANAKIYQQTLVKIRTTLGIKIGVSIRDVALKFGVLSLLPLAKSILERYKARCRENLISVQRQFVSFDNPAFEASALSLAAAKRKIRHFDNVRLVSAVGTTTVEFKRVRSSMIDTCSDMLGTVSRKRGGNKRKAPSNAGTKVQSKSIGTSSSNGHQSKGEVNLDNEEEDEEQRIARANQEYAEWRKSVMRKRKSETEKKTATSSSRKKQKTLFDTFGSDHAVSNKLTTKGNKHKKAKSSTSGKKSELDLLLAASFG
eukprot:g997.t1